MKTGVTRILMLEDSRIDADLVERALRSPELTFETKRVDNERDFRDALENFRPDLILSDSRIPGFSGPRGLEIVRDILPDVPVIFVSGTIGEERAVELLRSGATDYVLKDNLSRLRPAVVRALRELELRRERQEAEQRFTTIFENAVLGICQVAPDGTVLTANAAVARIFGFCSSRELQGQVDDLWSLFSDDSRYEELMRLLEEEGEARNMEMQIKCQEGRICWVSVNVWTVFGSDGEVLRHEAFVEDIHRRKELEAQVFRAQRLESIGTLASGVAHDLNNILAPILMSAPMLRREMTPDRRELIVSTIEASAERGAQIVKQVLAFGRGIAGERQAVNVSEMTDEVLKIVEGTFPKGIRIECLSGENLWEITGDPTQLHQVLLNLCVNARDAMGETGLLRVQTQNLDVDASYASMQPGAIPGRYVLIEVSDTGSGIAPQILDRIFDPFFTTKDVGKGTGLGLPTVLGIVKSHGGFLSVESELGHGSTFKVHLPAATTAAKLEPVTEEPLEVDGGGKLVLVVDDEATVGAAAKTVLETHGFRVLVAAEGTEALALFAQHQADVSVVLVDILMPYMDGVALTRILRRMNPDVPIVASTGQREKGGLQELESLGVKSVLFKPYRADALLRTLQSVIDCPRKISNETAPYPSR